MGIVIGVVIDVAVTATAAAAEAVAEAAAEALAEAAAEAAADAEEEAVADAAAKAEAEGAAEKAAKSEAESAAKDSGEAASVSIKVLRGIAELNKLIKEFFIVDAVFKTAIAIIRGIEGNSRRVQKLEKYLHVLIEMGKKMNSIKGWLENHKKDTVKLEGIDVPVDSGVLSKYMSPLAAGAGKLQILCKDVQNKNTQNTTMTDTQVEAMRRCLVKVNTTFESLAKFMQDKTMIVKVLSSFPISIDEGAGKLQILCKDVQNKNTQNTTMTDTQVEAMRRCLVKVNTTFESLAKFMQDKTMIVKVLSSFPISIDEVNDWKSGLKN